VRAGTPCGAAAPGAGCRVDQRCAGTVPNKGFHSKVGQFAGGVGCMKALGFVETEGRWELQLVWGLPDVSKLRGGFEAQMLGVEAAAISFAACEGSGSGDTPAAAPDPTPSSTAALGC
jgi:hypothetical protein